MPGCTAHCLPLTTSMRHFLQISDYTLLANLGNSILISLLDVGRELIFEASPVLQLEKQYHHHFDDVNR